MNLFEFGFSVMTCGCGFEWFSNRNLLKVMRVHMVKIRRTRLALENKGIDKK